MANKNKFTILYARLSNEDGSQGDSNSITNQKLILESYAKTNGFDNTKFLFDDGYSGTNFERPAFKKVIDLVEDDKVSNLIVKDMSRLGRNYLEVGKYTEIIFPKYAVRFIAINDAVDSINESSFDFVPMRNWFNELYAKDCSKKIRQAVRAKAETGTMVSTKAPFGYQKDTSNPKKAIVIDDEASEVVKYIFSLCISGKGPTQIATQLQMDGILTPSSYYYKQYGVKVTGYSEDNPYSWAETTITKILEHEVYIGNTVNLRTGKESYKSNKKIDKPKSDWIRFENTHEAIIDKETWLVVQDIRENRRRRTNFKEQNIFSGLVVCEDCGSKLVLHRSRNTDPKKYNFMCGNYKRNRKIECSTHYIREQHLVEIVLDDLRRVTYHARENQEVFMEYIAEKDNKELKKSIIKIENELVKLKSREAELSELFKRIYEDNVLGKIPNEVFNKLSSEYLKEQENVQNLIPEKIEELERLKNSAVNVTSFISKAKKYIDITELTAELLNTFIEKIEVSERSEKNSRDATQRISIHYRDIGIIGYQSDTEETA